MKLIYVYTKNKQANKTGQRGITWKVKKSLPKEELGEKWGKEDFSQKSYIEACIFKMLFK